MRLRIYSQTLDGEKHSAEIEIIGDVIRICDDHGRIVESEPWPEKEWVFPEQGPQPRYY